MFSWETYKFSETAIEVWGAAASIFTLLTSSNNLSAVYKQLSC